MEPESPGRSEKQKISILYVDDEPTLVEIGKIFLERGENLGVTTATSAEEALSLLAAGEFDGVVSDYQMPGMDGLELLREVRKLYGPLPFIIFTGRGREEVVIEALNAGVDSYLQKGGAPKPQFAELKNSIVQAVEKRRMARALEESEERYRTVVEDQTEMICWFDPDSVILFANDAFCQQFGVPREEMIGRRFVPPVPPDEKERLERHFSSLTPDRPAGHIDHRIIMPSGEVRWHGWTDRASFDSAGKLVRIQSVGRDITDYKNAEAKALASERRLKDVIEALPDPTFAIGADGRVTIWNRGMERLTDIPVDEAIGHQNRSLSLRLRLADIAIGLTEETDADNFCKAPRWEDGSLTGETVLADDDGSEHIYWGRVTPLLGPSGEIVGAIESIRDITEIRARERALNEANVLLEWMIDALPDIVGVMHPDHRIVRYNRAGYETLGMTHEEVVGKTCYSLIGRIHPCEVCATEMAVKSKKTETVEKYVPEMGKYLRCMSVPILDEKGEVLLIVEQLTEIPDPSHGTGTEKK